MKKFKRLLSVVLIVVFSLSLVTVSAFAADGNIVGDTNIYLPKEGAIKLPYILTTDGTTPVDGAVYSVAVAGVEAAETSKYAEFDANGYLYVGQMAKGKTLTVNAQSADYTASLTVNVCDTIYAEDFEDEIVGQTVTSEIFDTKTATVITEGDMHVPSDATANKIAKSYTNLTTWRDNEQLIINGNFVSSKLNVEAKIGSYVVDSNVYPNMNHATALKYANGTVYTKLSNTSTIQLRTPSPTDKLLDGIYGLGGAEYVLMPMHMTVTDNCKIDLRVNGKSLSNGTYDISSVKGTDSVLQSIAFGSFVDDIEIYSGEKAVSPYEITGQDTICRAPVGATAKFTYDVTPAIECAAADGAVSLALKEAYTGVNVSGSEVKVAGSANSGTFTVQAVDASGKVLDEKNIIIVDKIYSWADNYERAYVDFENQTVGNAPAIKLEGNSGWIDYVLEFATKNATFGGVSVAPVIKEDALHGKYVSARGYQQWTTDGSNFKIIPRTGNDVYKLKGVSCGTLEADFKLDLELMQSVSHYYSLFYVGNRDNAGLDMRYTEFADGTMGIYSFMTDAGYGNNASGGKLIATVPADTWFNLRVEADFVNNTYDLYLDNRMIVCGAKHTMPYVEDIFIGADVDNIAMYHGAKDVATIDNGSVFAGTAIGIKGQYNVEASQSKTVTFNLSEEVGDIAADTSLIVAHYSGGALAGISYAPVRVTGGKALGCVAVTGKFVTGDYVKAFIWNMDTLVPIR